VQDPVFGEAQIAAAEADLAAADDEGYVCHQCQNGKHLSCSAWSCTCCSGGDED